jgi:hypothetical protein
MYPPDNTRKRPRPPPIHVPLSYIPVKYKNASPTKNVGQPQQDQQSQQQQQTVSRNASSSTQQGPRSAKSELTSSTEHDGSRLTNSGSQRSRASALATLSNMMDQARASPRKSESGKSDTGSTRVKSTTRSKHSMRSHRSSKSSKALGNDERTARAKIEARSEQNLFKMTGQVPPTPMIGM